MQGTKAQRHRGTEGLSRNAATLAPLTTVGPTEHQQKIASIETAECPACEKTVVGAAIVSASNILRDPLTLIYSRSRYLYCNHCEHLVHWVQACNADGSLRQAILVGPVIYRSRDRINRFLKQHPEAAGVADAAQ